MSETARELLSIARHAGSGTVPLNSLPLPSMGFYVGGSIPEMVMTSDDVNRRDAVPIQRVIDFVHRAGTAYVGVWTDTETDKIHFDAVEWYAEEFTAAAIARVRGELAVWDIARERELRLAYVDGERS